MLDVLYEDNHLLVVNKPAGLPTMGVAADRTSLLDVAKEYIRRKYDKPGNVYLGIVSRLDAPVSGAVVLARTSKAAARLTEQFRDRTVDKTYWAVVSGSLPKPTDACVDWVLSDERHRKMSLSTATAKGAQEAKLRYRRLAQLADGWHLEIALETGRKHQIRLQLASRGFPVVGDRKYGSTRPFAAGIALHARRVSLDHPTREERIDITAPLPAAWRKLGLSDD